MWAIHVRQIVNQMTPSELMELSPNDILGCAAACDCDSVGKERWDIIRARTILLAGTMIAKSM